jgi:hypothetical protein
VGPWQCITIYRYTLPPPYEATEYLFEELPLSTYPSGTTLEPLAYEMAPGAHLGRAAPWTQALVLFPRCAPTQRAGSHAIGVSFREACDRGYLRPYDPQRVPDACEGQPGSCLPCGPAFHGSRCLQGPWQRGHQSPKTGTVLHTHGGAPWDFPHRMVRCCRPKATLR